MKMTLIKKNSRLTGLLFGVLAIIVALAFTTLVLLVAKAPPLQAFKNIIVGSVGSWGKISDVVVAWVPLLLATAGLLATFAAGLWNIGVEGQIMVGAIFTTGVLRMLMDTGAPTGVALVAGFVCGMVGGALWAALAGVLKIYGGVNEIFSGLGLNFVATAFTLWLIFGPWKRPGVGSMSGTEPFPQTLWMPMVQGTRFSPWALVVGLVGIAVIFVLLQGTYFGLKLKAVGKNHRAAFVIGIPTARYTMAAFVICGIFAGLAGAVQVMAVYHRLIPSISSGYGFLGLMVGMLVNYQAIWAAPVAFFFAALNIGSIQLPIVLKLDSTLSGVLQGALVLSVILVDGVRRRMMRKI
ncbi:MAG TPA: ABC transporter permease [Anaerolineaceae bacterium]